MSLTISKELLDSVASEHEVFEALQKRTEFYGSREITLVVQDFDDEALRALSAAFTAAKNNKSARAIDAVLASRQGNFSKPIPNFKAFVHVLRDFLAHECIDGWVYAEGPDGKLYAELVTEIRERTEDSRGQKDPVVELHTICYGLPGEGGYARRSERCGVVRRTHRFAPQDVTKRRVADALVKAGIYKETQALRDAHMGSVERFQAEVRGAFAQQFRLQGAAYRCEQDSYRRGFDLSGRRVIHDLSGADFEPSPGGMESCLFDSGDGVGQVPVNPLVRVFDLRSHEFFWVHADFMQPYVYDKSLRDKLVLPASHRDLLDVLTQDLGAFVDDIIEGKSAGNVILCKGIPGVGKTLTAEVYAELIEKPLYAIHSGSLGVTPTEVEKGLKLIFERAKRWGCELLLDEADVFVVQRGGSIEQNAIVAEFLRALEYFDGLMFMTTNRPGDIDDAIISRCAAIIDYQVPGPQDAAAIWRVLAQQYQADMNDGLIAALVALFPRIAPRDIKMLLRLALRVSKSEGKPLVVETFRRCAMFRAIEMHSEAA